jgi:hypothetical protein
MSHEERFDRLEKVVQILAEDQATLQKVFTEFVTETRRGFDQVAEQMRETDRKMRETDRKMRETDERLDKLVLAIGELIRQKPN